MDSWLKELSAPLFLTVSIRLYWFFPFVFPKLVGLHARRDDNCYNVVVRGKPCLHYKVYTRRNDAIVLAFLRDTVFLIANEQAERRREACESASLMPREVLP